MIYRQFYGKDVATRLSPPLLYRIRGLDNTRGTQRHDCTEEHIFCWDARDCELLVFKPARKKKHLGDSTLMAPETSRVARVRKIRMQNRRMSRKQRVNRLRVTYIYMPMTPELKIVRGSQTYTSWEYIRQRLNSHMGGTLPPVTNFVQVVMFGDRN